MIKPSDIVESGLGAFSAILFPFIIRDTPGPFIDPILGLLITVVYVFSIGVGMVKKDRLQKLAMNIIVSGVISYLMVVNLLKLATVEQVSGINFFGSPIIFAIWLALPVAILFDHFNVKSLLTRYYMNNRKR